MAGHAAQQARQQRPPLHHPSHCKHVLARYGGQHKAPELQKEAVYGLTELHRDQIRSARLVANPGCYPTTVQLPLCPLLQVCPPQVPCMASPAAGRRARQAGGSCRGARLILPCCGVAGVLQAPPCRWQAVRRRVAEASHHPSCLSSTGGLQPQPQHCPVSQA